MVRPRVLLIHGLGQGGLMRAVLGIDDKSRHIRGILPEKLDIVERWLRSVCNDAIDPPLDCVIRKLMVPDQQGTEKVNSAHRCAAQSVRP